MGCLIGCIELFVALGRTWSWFGFFCVGVVLGLICIFLCFLCYYLLYFGPGFFDVMVEFFCFFVVDRV